MNSKKRALGQLLSHLIRKNRIYPLSITFILIWLIHFIQVFTPETGFDALWYHLPVARAMAEHSGLVYIPNLYQSVNPLLSDIIFTIGYMFAGPLGTKIVAYIFALSTIAVTYFIARKILIDEYVWWAIICVSLIHTIAWQSASFYVDTAKAFWELLAVYILITALNQTHIESKTAWYVGLGVGASIATKAFSIVLIPFFAGTVWLNNKHNYPIQSMLFFLAGCVLISAPFYFHTFVHTGNLFFPLQHHLEKLQEIGGVGSLWQYLMRRLVLLPYSPIALLTARDYISPILVLTLPILIVQWKSLLRSKTLVLLSSFAVYQWLIWWFVPPVSTRYALSGFIILLILLIWALQRLFQKTNHAYTLHVRYVLIFAVIVTVIPRLFVAVRSFRYVLGYQSKKEYLKQFRDGNIDQHMDTWYEHE